MLTMNRLGTQWDPWHEFDRLRNEMGRIISAYEPQLTRRHQEAPAINIWHGKDGLIITADVPGVDADDLDITVTRNAVTISGRVRPVELQEGQTFHRRERSEEAFSRTIEMPFDVDPQGTEAKFARGVLTLKLQRPEEQKPQRVKIQAG